MSRYCVFFFIFYLIFLANMGLGQSKKVWLYHADDFYSQSDFVSALKYYQLTIDDTTAMKFKLLPYEVVLSNQKTTKDSNKISSFKNVALLDYVNHQIAMCYRGIYDYSAAVEWFKISAEKGAYIEDQYYYANSLMQVKAYEDALNAYEKYLRLEDKSDQFVKKAQLDMSGCHYAMNPGNIKKEVFVQLADTTVFNKGTAAFGAMYWGSENKLVFASARDHGVVVDPNKQESKYLCDLYWTERIEIGKWGRAHNFGRPLNSSKHEASGCFNNGGTIFFTKWSDLDKGVKHIHAAKMLNMKFFEAYTLDTNVNLDGYSSINPYVTIDGKWLYFSSDRPGGEGGMDLWRIRVAPNGKTIGEAQNLEAPVNSEFDEVTPFYHESTGTLFFSSNGHKSIGGLDVFKSAFDREAEYFGKPRNLGQPINSSKDDAYMIWDNLLKTGWLSSDRQECDGGHCYDIYQITNAPIKISIEGFVFDDETEEPIINATIEIRDVTYLLEPLTVNTDEEGFYETELEQNVEIFMKATSKGYFADAASHSTKNITETTVLVQDFFLRKIPGDEIAIEGIEYDFDSDRLRTKSKEILDTLVEFLQLNNNLIVQINSHTDNRGNNEYNMDLSKRRAKSCVDYLILKGIPQKRLIAKGYGESKPTHLLDDNKDPIFDSNGNRIYLTEEYINSMPSSKKKKMLHQRNRRTAFKVVGEGFQVESGNL